MCQYKVINFYPHNSQAFTQGLIYDLGKLYESTGKYQDRENKIQLSSLRQIKLETGETLQPPSPVELNGSYFGEGITLWKERLIFLTKEKRGFVYCRDTFKEIEQFFYNIQGWGLTHNRDRLIISNGTDKLYFLDPDDNYQLDREISVSDGNNAVTLLNELEYFEGEILANIYGSDRIARIDPDTGGLIGWIDLTKLRGSVGKDDEWKEVNNSPIAVLNGIAYDALKKRLFVTGKLWPYLFEIELFCH